MKTVRAFACRLSAPDFRSSWNKSSENIRRLIILSARTGSRLLSFSLPRSVVGAPSKALLRIPPFACLLADAKTADGLMEINPKALAAMELIYDSGLPLAEVLVNVADDLKRRASTPENANRSSALPHSLHSFLSL